MNNQLHILIGSHCPTCQGSPVKVCMAELGDFMTEAENNSKLVRMLTKSYKLWMEESDQISEEAELLLSTIGQLLEITSNYPEVDSSQTPG